MPKQYDELLPAQRRASAIARERSKAGDFEVWIYLFQGTYRLSSIAPPEYLAQRPKAIVASYMKAAKPREIK